MEFLTAITPDLAFLPRDALEAARMRVFVSMFDQTIVPIYEQLVQGESNAATVFLQNLEKYIIPWLLDNLETQVSSGICSFFGGSRSFTFVELMCAPYITRIYFLGRNDLLPQPFWNDLTKLSKYRIFHCWAQSVLSRSSVRKTFDVPAQMSYFTLKRSTEGEEENAINK